MFPSGPTASTGSSTLKVRIIETISIRKMPARCVDGQKASMMTKKNENLGTRRQESSIGGTFSCTKYVLLMAGIQENLLWTLKSCTGKPSAVCAKIQNLETLLSGHPRSSSAETQQYTYQTHLSVGTYQLAIIPPFLVFLFGFDLRFRLPFKTFHWKIDRTDFKGLLKGDSLLHGRSYGLCSALKLEHFNTIMTEPSGLIHKDPVINRTTLGFSSLQPT